MRSKSSPPGSGSRSGHRSSNAEPSEASRIALEARASCPLQDTGQVQLPRTFPLVCLRPPQSPRRGRDNQHLAFASSALPAPSAWALPSVRDEPTGVKGPSDGS